MQKNERTKRIKRKFLEIYLNFLLHCAMKERVHISGLTCVVTNKRNTNVQSYTWWELMASQLRARWVNSSACQSLLQSCSHCNKTTDVKKWYGPLHKRAVPFKQEETGINDRFVVNSLHPRQSTIKQTYAPSKAMEKRQHQVRKELFLTEYVMV